MATLSAQATSNQPLNYKTWVLKVSIHCEGCKRKVRKILHKINGVYTIRIDSQLQRVTVTGNVDIETLIKRLTKTGKHAELWPENLAGEEKTVARKSKNNGKENDPQSSINMNNNNNNIKKMERSTSPCTTTTNTSTVMSEAEKSTGNEESQRSKERERSPEKKSPVKKKKKQGQNGNFSSATGSNANQGVSVNHPYYYYYNNNYYNYPRDDYYYNIWPSSSMAYANRSYTAPHPSKTPAQFCYYPTPSWPYTCRSGYQQIYDHGSFEIFSDENANGCFIM